MIRTPDTSDSEEKIPEILNEIPLIDSDGNIITNLNKDNETTYDYFMNFVYGNEGYDDPIALNAYDYWLKNTYGYNVLEGFWDLLSPISLERSPSIICLKKENIGKKLKDTQLDLMQIVYSTFDEDFSGVIATGTTKMNMFLVVGSAKEKGSAYVIKDGVIVNGFEYSSESFGGYFVNIGTSRGYVMTILGGGATENDFLGDSATSEGGISFFWSLGSVDVAYTNPWSDNPNVEGMQVTISGGIGIIPAPVYLFGLQDHVKKLKGSNK